MNILLINNYDVYFVLYKASLISTEAIYLDFSQIVVRYCDQNISLIKKWVGIKEFRSTMKWRIGNSDRTSFTSAKYIILRIFLLLKWFNGSHRSFFPMHLTSSHYALCFSKADLIYATHFTRLWNLFHYLRILILYGLYMNLCR